MCKEGAHMRKQIIREIERLPTLDLVCVLEAAYEELQHRNYKGAMI